MPTIAKGSKPSSEGSVNSLKNLILPTSYFGDLWQDCETKIRKSSPYSFIPSYKIRSYMIKSGDDLRQ